MSRRVALFLVALSTTIFAPRAEAGIVNVQSALATESKPGLSGSATATVDWRTGNSKLLLLGLSPVARFRAGDHLLIAILRGDYGKSGSTNITSKAFEHLRYRYDFHPRVLGELFQQAEYDKFKLLKSRVLVGAGPKVDLLSDKRLSLSWGVAYMFEYEKPSSGALETDSEIFHRVSSYLMARFELDDRVQIVETVYAQPCITDPADVKLLNESQVVIQLTTRIALKSSLVVGFDAEPLHKNDGTRLERLDTATKTSVTVSF